MNTRKVLDKAVQKRDSWIYVRELYHDFYLDKFRIIRSNCKINTNTKFWTKVSKKETREYERSWIIPRFLSRPKFQYNSKFFRIVKLTPLIRIQSFGQSCPKKRRVNMNIRELYHDFYLDLSFESFVRIVKLIRIQSFGQRCPKKRRVNMNVRELYHDFYLDLSFSTIRNSFEL